MTIEKLIEQLSLFHPRATVYVYQNAEESILPLARGIVVDGAVVLVPTAEMTEQQTNKNENSN